MARTNNTNTNKTTGVQGHNTAFAMVGTITNVYEGKKYNYINIKVHPTSEQYYSNFTVTAPTNIELYDDGTDVSITGVIKSFFDREAQKTTYTFMCTEIKPVSKD